MRKLNGITINSESLAYSLVIYGIFRAICTISPVIMRDFVSIINKIDTLDGAVKISNFNCDNERNSIDIEFENNTSKGGASLYFKLTNGEPTLTDCELHLDDYEFSTFDSYDEYSPASQNSKQYSSSGVISNNPKIEFSNSSNNTKNPSFISNQSDSCNNEYELYSSNNISYNDEKYAKNNTQEPNDNKTVSDEFTTQERFAECLDNGNNTTLPNITTADDNLSNNNTSSDSINQDINNDIEGFNCINANDENNFDTVGTDNININNKESDTNNRFEQSANNFKEIIDNEIESDMSVEIAHIKDSESDADVAENAHHSDTKKQQSEYNNTINTNEQDLLLNDAENDFYKKQNEKSNIASNSQCENDNNSLNENDNDYSELDENSSEKSKLKSITIYADKITIETGSFENASALSQIQNGSSNFNNSAQTECDIGSKNLYNDFGRNAVGNFYNGELGYNGGFDEFPDEIFNQSFNNQMGSNSGSHFSNRNYGNINNINNSAPELARTTHSYNENSNIDDISDLYADFYGSYANSIADANSQVNSADSGSQYLDGGAGALSKEDDEQKLLTLEEFITKQKAEQEAIEKKRRKKFRIVGSRERINARAIEGGMYVSGNKVFKWGSTRYLDE